MSDSGHIPPSNRPDWLPADWTMEVRSSKGKNVKSYIHQLTGSRFYSKPKVLEYLGTVKNDTWMPQKETAGSASIINFSEEMNVTVGSFPHGWVTETPPKENGSQSGKSYEVGASEMLPYGEMVAEKSPDWLPAGWTEEVKERNGKIVKTYVDPLWGHRFYSKPQVLQYLGVATNDTCTAQRETSGNNSESNLVGRTNGTPERLPHVSMLTTPWENSSHSKVPEDPTFTSSLEASDMPHSRKIVVEKTPDWLPAGWTEEVKISNGRSIKSYINSSTGRKFYSKPKVLEYLEYLGTAKIETAKIDEGTSQKKKIGNDFDINLPVKINDPPESLPHGQITELETRENGSGAGRSYRLPLETIDDSLPDGWITEVKHRKIGSLDGKPYKQYIDPVTGRKFLSKQKVFEYLGTVKPNSSTSRRRKTVLDDVSDLSTDKIEGVTPPPQPVESQNGKVLNDTLHSSTSKEKSYKNRPGRKPNTDTSGSGIPPPQVVETQSMKTLDNTAYESILKETSSSEQPGRKISMEHPSPRELPLGWIKEIKIQKTGNKTRKISYYIDPVSGYVFLSLMDAWRYVEAGDISKCVIKPKKREEMGFATEQSLPNMNQIVSNPPSLLLEGAKRVNMRKSTRFSPENEKLSSSKQSDSEPNVVKILSNTPSQPLEGNKHVNTRKRTRSSPEDGKFISSKQCDSEPNTDKIVSNTPSQLLEATKDVNTRKRTRFSAEDRNLTSSKQYDREIVIERVAAEGLPSGWIKEVKIEKFYTDPRSGYVFMSQKDALRYVETGDIGKCAIKPRSREELGLDEGATITSASGQLTKTNKTGPPVQQLEQSQNEYTSRLTRSRQKEMSSGEQSGREIVLEKVTPKGLPSGSIMEDSIQRKTTGTRTDALEMNKNRGKPALQLLKQSHTVSTPEHATFSYPQNEMTSSKQSGKEIVIERVPPEGLPPGWIKEIKIQKKADVIRRDTYYTDPVNGYVFSSQKDVIRYVETGDINNCAMKPKNRDQLGLNQGSSAASPPVMQKPGHDTTKKQPSTGKNVSSKSSLETMDSDVSQKRRQTRSSVASPPVMLQLERDTTKKQLSAATNVGSKRSLETTETDVSAKRRQTRASASAVATKNPTVELPKEVAEVDNVIQNPMKAKRGSKNRAVELTKEVPKVGNVIQKPTKSKRGTKNPIVELPKEVPTVDNVIQKPMKTEKGNGSSRSPLSEGKVSMRKRGSIHSPPTTESLQLKNVQKNTTKTSSKGKTLSRTSQTKKETKKEKRTPPSRFSKRILGLNTETTNSGSSKQALTAEVVNSGEKDDILCINVPAGVASCEKTLASDVENSGKNEGNPGPSAPNNVATCEQVLTLELDNSGKDENVPCPNVPYNVDDNAPQQIDTVAEMGKTEFEKLGEIKEIQCANSPADVAINAPQQFETVLELDKPNHALGGSAESPSDSVSNKNNEATEDQAECQTVSQEQPTEVSNKSNEVLEDQAEDQTVSLEKPAKVLSKSKEVMEDHADDPITSLEQPAEVSNKSKEAVEDQADDATMSLEQPADVSNKSKEVMEDQAENRTVSQDQTLYQFGEETWSDPCLDFAFKTLTGALPFEDNAQVQNIFQLRADTPQVKTADNCLTLLDFDAPNVREVNPSHAQKDSEALHQVDNSDAQNVSEAPAEPEPVSQLHSSPVFLPDMNSSLPSGSETAPQQVDSEENTNSDKNVLTLDNYARFLF